MLDINQENDESKKSDSNEIIQLKKSILELEDKLKRCRTNSKIYFIRFVMQKGVGSFPKVPAILNLFPDKEPLQVIKDNMKFLLNNDSELLPIDDYELIDNGFSHLEIDKDEYTWGPKPVIWLLLNEDLEEKDSRWNDALQSDYELLINNINNEEPFYFQDHNGYSRVYTLEWVAETLDENLDELLSHLEVGKPIQISEDLTILKMVTMNSNTIDIESEEAAFTVLNLSTRPEEQISRLEITFKNRKYFWGSDLVFFGDLVQSQSYLDSDKWRSQNIWLINELVAIYIEENY
jgi:hypothetical protein